MFPKLTGESRSMLFGFSPWLIVGLSFILALAITVLAARNVEREQQFMTQNLLARGEALIWALEAGTRTWMGFQGEPRQLQKLVEETATQPGILYMCVVSNNGQILAHSDQSLVGAFLAKKQIPEIADDLAMWRMHGEGADAVFEVFRWFTPMKPDHHRQGAAPESSMPMRPGMGRHHRPDSSSLWEELTSEYKSIAIVGMDRRPLERVLAEDFGNNLLTALVVAFVGLGGFISLFWAHNYRRSRRLLKDTQALASQVVTSLPLGLITSEPSGRLGMINSAALSMLNTTREAIADTPVSKIPGLAWDKVITALNKLGRAARRGRAVERELPLTPPGGKPTTVSVGASQIRDEDGAFLGNLFILRDVGEMRRLQQEVQRNEKLTALGALAAGVAHEIRNPLSSIKGLAMYLSGKVPPEGPEQEAARTLAQEVNRLNRVVSELLDFARPGEVQLARTDINEVIRHALRLAEADISSKRIRVNFRENSKLPPAASNAERLTQALLNLFLNAVQAMDEGGQLTVEADLNPADNTFSIAVKDTGSGMTPETQAAMFTPYFTTKPTGTGLGLAIVLQIVEAHHGRVAVRSAPGEGSTFTLILPLGHRPDEQNSKESQ